MAGMLKTNAGSRDRVGKWKQQLADRGALSPAMGSDATPNSVNRTVTVGMEWVEERQIHPLTKLRAEHPDIDWERSPPCPIFTVDDARKRQQRVVLTQMPESPPKLRVYCRT